MKACARNRVPWLALSLSLIVACSARNRDRADTAPEPGPYDLSGFYNQLEDYIEKFHDPSFKYDPHDLEGRFSYQPGKECALYGSTDMVYLLWTIEELDRASLEIGARGDMPVIGRSRPGTLSR